MNTNNSTIFPWVKKKLKRITNRLNVSELELLEMVATYRGQTLLEFVVEAIKKELATYCKDSKFGTWLEETKNTM